jgi:hypothetical protein
MKNIDNIEIYNIIENNIDNNILSWECEQLSNEIANILIKLGVGLFFINGKNDLKGYKLYITNTSAPLIKNTITTLKNQIYYEKHLKEEYEKEKLQGDKRKIYIFVDTHNDHDICNPTISEVTVHNGISFKLLNLLLNHTYNRFNGDCFIKALNLVNAEFTIDKQEKIKDYEKYLEQNKELVIRLNPGNY